jgi:glycosyltransferase involved in cell wall biosynthesis
MAAGLAIITTKNTGCEEVVGDSALLVEPRSPIATTEALEKLVDNPDFSRELGEAARRRLEENFTWNVVASKYIDIYCRFATDHWQ